MKLSIILYCKADAACRRPNCCNLSNEEIDAAHSYKKLCMDKIDGAVNSCSGREVKIPQDVFSTKCIPDDVKRAVFDGVEHDDKMVIAGR